MKTLDLVDLMRRAADRMEVEHVRGQKLTAEQLAAERALLLQKAVKALKASAPTNGTNRDIRRNVMKDINRHFGIDDEDAA